MAVRPAAAVVAAGLMLAGCAPPGPSAPPAPDITGRLARADTLLRTGCFDCLLEAFDDYESLRRLPNLLAKDVDAATAGAVRSALLLELRQRELGMADDGYLQRARSLVEGRADLQIAFAPHFYTVESMPRRTSRFIDAPDPAALRQMQELRANFAALVEERRASADADPLSAYGWLAFYCTHSASRADRSATTLRGPLTSLHDAPIVDYRAATCLGTDVEALRSLQDREPRFVEIEYWLAQNAQSRRDIEDAERRFGAAFDWRPRWPAVTFALGNLYFAFEEHERALDFFDRTLEAAPGHPEAAIGRIKALSLLGRVKDAFAAIDAVLAVEPRVLPGEAFYWRAWNNTQINDLDQAWVAIEQANQLWVNSEVLKLGGIIAYRRLQRPTAIDRFGAARKIAPDDCENIFYLGTVHAELRDWPPTRTVLTDAARCIEQARDGLRNEITVIEASTWDPARKARQIARREAQITAAARMLTTSWFNIAIAHLNLGSHDEARQFAERVLDDERFSERARDILKRLQ